MTPRERYFFDFYKTSTGYDLLEQPAGFHVDINGRRSRYTPDFYCRATRTFFEVIGSRQAWEHNRHKIAAFTQQWPEISLQVVHPDGRPHSPSIAHQRNPAAIIGGMNRQLHRTHADMWDRREATAERLCRFHLASGFTERVLAQSIGCRVHHILSGRVRRPRLSTTIKIEAFLKASEKAS